jgi:hypothetical protein
MKFAIKLLILGCICFAVVLRSQPQADKLQINPDPDGERMYKAEWNIRAAAFEKIKIANPKPGHCKSEYQSELSYEGDIPIPYDVTLPLNATVTNITVYSREAIDGYPWKPCPMVLGQQCPQGGNAALPYEYRRDGSDQSLIVRVPVMKWSKTLTRVFRVVVDYDLPQASN